MKIPFFLITGFLGSGKTTLLKNTLEKYNGKLKIGIVQNEFAPINVDSLELKFINPDFNILEINNGSALCVCNIANFIPSLKKFIEYYKPEIVLMESSGLTDPVNIIDVFNVPEINEKLFISNILCIVNCANIDKLLSINLRIKNQILMADEIVMNKIDLVANKNYLNELVQKIKNINPHAKIHLSEYCKIDTRINFFDNIELYKIRSKNLEVQNIRPNIEVKVLKTINKISIEKLNKFINENKDKLLRVKGILNYSNEALLIQYDGVELNYKIVEYELNNISILVFIGENISGFNFKLLLNNENL